MHICDEHAKVSLVPFQVESLAYRLIRKAERTGETESKD